MTADLKHAMRLLEGGSSTCVLVQGDRVFSSTARGVRPLLDWLDAGTDLSGFSAADKVVGKATAMLYCLLGVKAVYTRVISRSAALLLEYRGIAVHWQTQVEFIQNRDKTGRCPMEQAVWTLEDPAEGLAAIRETLKRLQSRT